MGTKREGLAGKGMHRYKLTNGMEAVYMAEKMWRIFDNKGSDIWDAGDTGVIFKTLRQCQKWAKGEASA